MISIAGVPWNEARRVWPLAGPWTADALAHSGDVVTADDVLRMIEAGKIGLWLVLEDGKPVASFTTAIEDGALTWLTLGGIGMKRWLFDAERAVVMIAKAMNCNRIRISGRRGWARMLEPVGWRETAVRLAKDI